MTDYRATRIGFITAVKGNTNSLSEEFCSINNLFNRFKNLAELLLSEPDQDLIVTGELTNRGLLLTPKNNVSNVAVLSGTTHQVRYFEQDSSGVLYTPSVGGLDEKTGLFVVGSLQTDDRNHEELRRKGEYVIWASPIAPYHSPHLLESLGK